MDWRVERAEPGVEVQAWSTRRLPFDGETLRDLRAALAAECVQLTAGTGELLHAVYSSADRGRADVENVLLYNLHRQIPASRSGVLLERSFTPAGPHPSHAHHHRYRVAPWSTTWTAWKEGDPLGTLRFVAPPGLFSRETPGPWWLAARRGELAAYRRGTDVPERYGLRVRLTPPPGQQVRVGGKLKAVVDGLVAALQAHGPIVDPRILERARSLEPGLDAAALRALLTEPAEAPLGRASFLFPRGDGLQLSPADDPIVALDVRVVDGEPGLVTAEALDVALR